MYGLLRGLVACCDVFVWRCADGPAFKSEKKGKAAKPKGDSGAGVGDDDSWGTYSVVFVCLLAMVGCC